VLYNLLFAVEACVESFMMQRLINTLLELLDCVEELREENGGDRNAINDYDAFYHTACGLLQTMNARQDGLMKHT
jgi:hypothetical protein